MTTDRLLWLVAALPVLVGAYAYGLYPLVLAIIARLRRAPVTPDGESRPLVSLVVPAYNEEAQIRGAIEALIGQDYPADLRQILIVSDASTDGTDAIVKEYAGRGVELLRVEPRSGKTAIENASIPLLRGSIIINSDASVRLHPKAVSGLVRAMADPAVGVASSRDVSIARSEESQNTAEAGYVGYEMWVRGLETRAGGIVGASGSGYAIRKELHSVPIRADLSRDFSAALTAQRHGFRAVSDDSVLCFVPRTGTLQREYRRKVRTISRGMDTLYFNRELLDPKTNGSFAWKLFSHKVARWMMPLLAVPATLALIILSRDSVIARVLVAMALVGVVCALLVWRWPEDTKPPRLLAVVAFGMAANAAVVHAFWRFYIGHQDHIWEPTRRSTT
jgi:glycosyltransferase involved in cell wall biosynthesis